MDHQKFFSQNWQDRFLETNIFPKILNGYFVDIGANDGVTISNTYFFEKKGWRGLCIEPIPGVFEKLKANRRCECVCGAISESVNEYMEFLHIIGPEMLSGVLSEYSPEHLGRIDRELKETGGQKETLKVKNYHFNDIVKEQEIDYLSIDTEGAEFSIIKSIDFSKFDIKVISVENDYGDKNMREFLKKQNFKHLDTIGSDEIYINKKYQSLVRHSIMIKCHLFSYCLYKKTKRKIRRIWGKA